MRRGLAVLSLTAAVALSACGLITSEGSYKNPKVEPVDAPPPNGSLLGGDGGIDILGGNKKPTEQGGIGVNSFLWRASLDTLSFMPLASADPFGGVIITEWYSPPDAPQERFKLNVFILDRQLRSDSLRAAVFHQRRGPNGDWLDVPTEPNTATDLENSILTRARQLRVSTTAAK
jgi:hypothetical protein